MANEEHKQLASFLKDVHSNLRKSSSKEGSEAAWIKHCKNKQTLLTYAQCMEKLATTHWDSNSQKHNTNVLSRIKWSAEFCYDYFIKKSYLNYRHKDIDIAKKININIEEIDDFSNPVALIDVGSCYNPFKDFDYLDVFAIDLYPANDTVKQCDFLTVPLGSENRIEENKVLRLKENFFDVVTFCFVLEYIPDSKLRIKACIQAYHILKKGGLLIINTPDSKHVGSNSKIMKNWRYTLACMGFSRIKYEKFAHMHCMAFRKTLHIDIAVRWATMHKEPYMEYAINIPQDYNLREDIVPASKTKVSIEDFQELPFF